MFYMIVIGVAIMILWDLEACLLMGIQEKKSLWELCDFTDFVVDSAEDKTLQGLQQGTYV